MRILHPACLLFLVVGCAGRLHSQTTLHFDSFVYASGSGYSVGDYGVIESGFLFAAPRSPEFVNGGGLWIRNPPPGLLNANGLNTVPYNGSNYAVAFTSAQPLLKHASGLPFQLYSIDLAPYSASFSDPNTFTITGYYASGGSITTQLVWNGTLQGQAGDFHTYVFGAEWSNLDYVLMSDSVPWASGVGFSIDNVIVSAIPEPSSLGLGLGLVVLLFSQGYRLIARAPRVAHR